MEVVDLKSGRDYIEQYVNLRNSFAGLLLTSPVDISGTEEWLKKDDIEIRGLVKGGVLEGAVILYLGRAGEIAFFAREQGRGVGSELLDIIERVAAERKLGSVWAWALTSNIKARKTFIKNGYALEGEAERIYLGEVKKGLVFKKILKEFRR